MLIDSGTEAGAAIVQNNVRALNFLMSDVAVLLHSHEHFDHVGGMAALQAASGARVYASKEAADVLRTGKDSAGDPQHGMHPPFAGMRVDKIVADGEVTGWDDTDFTAIATPGHTPGALSWQWESCEGSNCVTIVYADSMSPVSADGYRFSDHPDYVAEYRKGIARIAAAKCDILLTPHPSASDMNRRLVDGSALIDDTACERYAASVTQRLDERLAKETARAK